MTPLDPSQPLTFGQKAVGLTFNPSKDPNVDQVKSLFANIIDLLNTLRQDAISEDFPEKVRYLANAITEAQTAQMWAVKAITWTYSP